MRLIDLGRTSAFRTTILFSSLLIASVLLLFALIYWQSVVILTDNLDRSLLHETRELRQTDETSQAANLMEMLQSDLYEDWQAGLFDRDHHLIAGNIPAWPDSVPQDGEVHPLHGSIGPVNRHLHEVRVVADSFPNGRILVMARRADEVHEFREIILRSLSVGLIASMALALFGGLVMAFASLRRIEAMHRATAEIVSGDLSRRLPTKGSADDFDKLALIVNGMLAEIERLVGDIKSAGDNIAHDLRTPLTRLRAGLEGTLRRGGADPELYRRAMQNAIAETDQILSSFRALLRISEVESGQRRAGFTAVDLAKLVAAAAELYEPTASENGLDFSTSIETTHPVQGDADLLFEAVANLLDNAIKFTPEGGKVTVRLSQNGTIAIEDSGPGLPPERREALFQRFTRGDKARQLPGNGLGLSLVAAVARLHNIQLNVSDAMPGCRIEMVLP